MFFDYFISLIFVSLIRKQVTCLCVSMDGVVLVSGSHDFDVRIWDIASHQCIRKIPHKGNTCNKVLKLISHV